MESRFHSRRAELELAGLLRRRRWGIGQMTWNLGDREVVRERSGIAHKWVRGVLGKDFLNISKKPVDMQEPPYILSAPVR
jgi:hypothetical protein